MLRCNPHQLVVLALIGMTIVRVVWFQPVRIQEGTRVSYQAKVVSEPQIKNTRQQVHLKPQSNNQKLQEFIIYLPRYPEYQYADVVQLTGKVGKHLIIEDGNVKKIGNASTELDKILNVVRAKFRSSIEQAVPEPHASLVIGMVIGSARETPRDLATNLQRTGTVHMLVVSGFNITLLTNLMLRLGGYIKRKYAVVIAILGSWAFVFLAGGQPPALRAGVMASAALAGSLWGRQTNAVTTLTYSACILLMYSPELAYSLSFQLSCAATAGVIILPESIAALNEYIYQTLKKFLRIPNSELLGKSLGYLNEELSVTLAAQLAVMPIIWNSFGTISLISPLSNILVAWSVPYIMITGAVVGLAGIVSSMLAMFLSHILIIFTAYFLQMIEWTASSKWAYFTGVQINNLLIVSVYIFITILIIKTKSIKSTQK